MTRYLTPPCPQDETHGPLLAWPGETTAWYCPHRGHTGNPFYTTDLLPASRRTSQPDLAGLGADSRDGAATSPEAPGRGRPAPLAPAGGVVSPRGITGTPSTPAAARPVAPPRTGGAGLTSSVGAAGLPLPS